jgi:hypothetical protein
MKKLLIYALTIFPVSLLIMPTLSPMSTSVYGITENERVTEEVNSILAFAFFDLEPASSFSGVSLRVEETDEQTEVFLHILTFDGSTQSEYDGGIRTTDEDIFNVDRQLNSAELSEIELDMCLAENFDFSEFKCTDVIDTVSLLAQWQGIGDLERRNVNNVQHDPFFEHRHGINWIRQTTAEGSLDGFEADEAVLGNGSGQLFYIKAKCTGSTFPACEE